MLNLTRQEKIVLLIFFSVLLVGVSIVYLSKKIPAIKYLDNLKIDSLRQVNINKVTKESLEKLPGVGLNLAQRIVDFRDSIGGFKNIDQLKLIKGIKEKKFQRIKKYFVID